MDLSEPTHLKLAEDDAFGCFTLRTHKLVAKAYLYNPLTRKISVSISVPLQLDGANVVLPAINLNGASIRLGDVEVYNDERGRCVEHMLKVELDLEFPEDGTELQLRRSGIYNKPITIKTSHLSCPKGSHNMFLYGELTNE
jgi:hypothetical protein